MTVEENLLMGAFPKASWRDRRRRRSSASTSSSPSCGTSGEQRARTLSGGERRLVGLGRGLMREGSILLIDEPSLGLAPVMIDNVYGAIRSIVRAPNGPCSWSRRTSPTSVSVADDVHVLETGSIVRSGSLRGTARPTATVVETYLGVL